MSRTVAAALIRLLDLATLPMSARQRGKTLSRIAGDLDRRGAETIATKHGKLRLLTRRGPHVASAVVNFATDEPETLDWIDTTIRPGEALWDIGANIGLYSLYAALRGIEVVAFEPKAMTFGLLVEHLALNELGGRVTPVCAGLADRTAMARLQVGSLAAGGAGNALAGAATQFGAAKSVFSQAIPAFTADDFCRLFALPPPRHVKLDVDGIEPAIIAGASRTLRSVETLLIEVEGANVAGAGQRIDRPLAEVGLREDVQFRQRGSRRNRLYRRR